MGIPWILVGTRFNLGNGKEWELTACEWEGIGM